MTYFEAQRSEPSNDCTPPEPIRRGGPRASRGHVLVVEDDENVRESMGQLLEEEGYAVSLAENGHEALTRLYTESPPDVIALDLRMPVMDGWEFRAIQVKDPKLRQVPVVAISADGSAQAAAISAEAYLQRPVEAKTLLATIKRVMVEAAPKPAPQPAPPDVASGWPAPWGQSPANVEYEISNPLYFVLINLREALEKVRPSIQALEISRGHSLSPIEVDRIRASLKEIELLLDDGHVAGERIQYTIAALRRLAAAHELAGGPTDKSSF
jgi:CheY-like chemotaxis protein